MSETGDQQVREAWAVLRRYGQVPLPIDPEGTVFNPRLLLQINLEGMSVALSLAKGPGETLRFSNTQAAREFYEAVLMHWSLVR